jgi:AAA domain
MMNKKLVLIRGMPGSGKSTIAAAMDTELDSIHLEADMYFMFGGKYNFDAGLLHRAHMWCQEETDRYLKQDYVVVVSNTFTTIKELRPYFDIALSNGILPAVYLAQNQFKNIHDVPQESLDRMKRRFVYDISALVTEYQQTLG